MAPNPGGEPTVESCEDEVERFDMGEGRFVERLHNNRLRVGALDDEEADRIVAEWTRRMKRQQEDDVQEAEAARLRAKKEAEALVVQQHAEALARARSDELERRAKEAERAKQEEERLLAEEKQLQEEQTRLEDLARQEEVAKQQRVRRHAEQEEKNNQALLDAFLKENEFSGINEPKTSTGWAVWKPTTMYPLHVAAEIGDRALVELLLQSGADRSLQTSMGKTALEIARDTDKDGSHTEVVKLLDGGRSSKTPRFGGA